MMQPTWQTSDGAIRLYHADCLSVLPTLKSGSVDAVITDPPYSSGGAFRGDRTQSTVTKYVQSGVDVQRFEFGGDTRDQRSFFAWCTLWLNAARHASRPGASLCSFIDWRQLPVMTDSIQAGGWVWRNIATWWKPGCRMQRGRFSSSAEYVIYGSNGPHSSDGEDSPQNVLSCSTLSGEEKEHIAEKPLEVAKWLRGVKCVMRDASGIWYAAKKVQNQGQGGWFGSSWLSLDFFPAFVPPHPDSTPWEQTLTINPEESP